MFEHTHNVLTLERPRRGWKALAAIGVISVLLLFVQSADLVHSHETDVASTIHCDICLKAGFLEHGLASKAPVTDSSASLIEYLQPEFRLPKSYRLTTTARAPPLNS